MLLENITRLCKEKNLSIAKLERETGIGNGTIGRWDESSPKVDTLKKVADFFGVSVDSLLVAHEDDCHV